MLYPNSRSKENRIPSSNELDTIGKRKVHILGFNELDLKIKGEGYTNLRIFGVNEKDNHIRFRIDKSGLFDYTMNEIKWLDNEHPELETLASKYGFDGATVDDIDYILELTKDMKAVKSNNW